MAKLKIGTPEYAARKKMLAERRLKQMSWLGIGWKWNTSKYFPSGQFKNVKGVKGR